MEILRFEQAPADAPKRKKSSRSFLALGLVATLFGVSTAFASSTIAINGGTDVQLGQGVVTVSGCDTNIGFKPVTTLASDATSFKVTDFIIGYDYSDTNDLGLIDTTACDLKQMKVTLYKDKVGGGVDLVKCATTYDSTAAAGNALKNTLVGISRDGTANSNFPEYVADFKCSTDGSFYFEMNQLKASQTGSTMRIHWYDQSGFIFKPEVFDHITIESVTGETGLSGV
jgi:hypothetical protein